MSEIEEALDEIDALVKSIQMQTAEERLKSLMVTIGPSELRVWDADLRRTIDGFLPKRRKALSALLVQLQSDQTDEPGEHEAGQSEHGDARQLGERVLGLVDELEDLSQSHIFQWATFYRDVFAGFYDDVLDTAEGGDISLAVEATREAARRHAQEIFTKGFYHVTKRETEAFAVSKSVSGLQRFLDIPLELYSAHLSADMLRRRALLLRGITSALLAGVVEGFAHTQLGSTTGAEVLGSHSRSWLHIAGFLREDHLARTTELLPQAFIRHGLSTSVEPLAAALDQLVREASDYIPLPVLAQFSWSFRRLDVSLQPPRYAPDSQLVAIHCYLEPDFVTTTSLSEGLTRGVGSIIAPLRPDLRNYVAQDSRLDDIVVPVMDDPVGVDVTKERVRRSLEQAIYRRRTTRAGNQPLAYNFAREFPLSNPFLTRYYYVLRTSVRDLLRTFERRNGVRLWCSVRRSGKTTAGLDLGTTTGTSTLISQTCDSTGQAASDSLLYESVCGALAAGSQLSPTFLAETIRRCTSENDTADQRIVLVLDEYETLFGHLRTAVDADERLRYTVAQPLLNQLVAFTRDNLLVFLGQQPNAHFILMDQNQLSPYVEQDPFPLFRHSTAGPSEFTELISKVFSNRATFDQSFANRLYRETSGHPFLTVNLLVEFVEWLIKAKRPVNQLHFSDDDFSSFATRMLRRDRISTSPEYEFFRDGAVPQALGGTGRTRSSWLYAMYGVLRAIALDSPETFTCSRDEFATIVDKLRLSDLGYSADYLLTTGTQSNFLVHSDRAVAPAIRLLARIAAVATPAVNM